MWFDQMPVFKLLAILLICSTLQSITDACARGGMKEEAPWNPEHIG
jgi:hypothetical protein